MQSFKDFYSEWHDRVKVQTSASVTKEMYFQTSRDSLGFDVLPSYIKEQGVDWSVAVAGAVEKGTSLAARLDGIDLAKFRMIFDRHMVNLSRLTFDEEYHSSSDERSLFMIYHRVPPVRIFSAMSQAKNVTFDFLHREAADGMNDREVAILSALSTLFLIELNHIMRVYIYFERQVEDEQFFFDVLRPGDERPRDGYAPPDTNGQMSYPDKTKFGLMELF